MSIRKLTATVPAAIAALGLVAFSATASLATDNARDDYVTGVITQSAPDATVGFTVGTTTNTSQLSQSDRYSGFGFRGEGFETSGQYK